MKRGRPDRREIQSHCSTVIPLIPATMNSHGNSGWAVFHSPNPAHSNEVKRWREGRADHIGLGSG